MIYGRQKIRIKKYDDYEIKCDHCKSYDQRFYVYQEYFHLMFIPIFPSSAKTIKCKCVNCNDAFNQVKKDHYLSITKTPFYLYSGVILFFALIFFGVTFGYYAKMQTNKFVKNPMIGDVYRMVKQEGNSKFYFFIKIKGIHEDTLELMHNNLEYSRFISEMNDSDYFVKDDSYKILKHDLVKGQINSVERDYNVNSRFRIEK